MTPETLVSGATMFALIVLSVAFLMTVYRVVVGPTLPDRVIALDMLVGIAIGFIATIAIRTGVYLYVDIAVALCLVGFLATVAFGEAVGFWLIALFCFGCFVLFVLCLLLLFCPFRSHLFYFPFAPLELAPILVLGFLLCLEEGIERLVVLILV